MHLPVVAAVEQIDVDSLSYVSVQYSVEHTHGLHDLDLLKSDLV